jgi:hypothetical protein
MGQTSIAEKGFFGTSAISMSIKFLQLAGKSAVQTNAKKETITKIRKYLLDF